MRILTPVMIGMSLVSFFTSICFAQAQSLPSYSAPNAQSLQITTNQTTTIVFPSAIKSVDRGAPTILAKTIKGITNVLKVKASSSSMMTSNLTVFTADGSIYAFRVTYADSPTQLLLNYSATSTATYPPPVLFNDISQTELSKYADSILAAIPNRRHPRAKQKGGMHMRLTGLFAHKGIIYFKFTIHNRSSVPYQPDFSRFYVRDAHRQKRTISTEKEVVPLIQKSIPTDLIGVDSTVQLVVAFKQFTISDSKQFVTECYEKSGDRKLTCSMSGNDLLKVRNLPE